MADYTRGYNRGDRVLITVYGGDKVERRVWLPLLGSAAICTEEMYQTAQQSGEEPVTVGFRYEWIEPVDAKRHAEGCDMALVAVGAWDGETEARCSCGVGEEA